MTYDDVPTVDLTPQLLAELRQRVHGVRVNGNASDRFLAKCVRDGATGCVVWLANSYDGYGQFGVGNRSMQAHRFAYEYYIGPIPDGLVIDHLCRNRACVNLEHLRPVTRRENTLAPGSESVTKVNADKTHCNNGHPLDEENTYCWPGSRSRKCRKCNTQAVLRYKTRRRANEAGVA